MYIETQVLEYICQVAVLHNILLKDKRIYVTPITQASIRIKAPKANLGALLFSVCSPFPKVAGLSSAP
jgi:hypothetical protein